MRKKFYRQAQKAICVATLSATVLTSIPMISYTEAYAKGQITLQELQELSLPVENAITYDLSDASLWKEKTFVDILGDDMTTTVIEINITKSGNYIIKGSNEINGAFIDTHIKVEEGVEANLIFDGVQIHNDQTYKDDMDTSGNIYPTQLFPILDIEGTANLYVQKDSCLTLPSEDAYSGAIQVLGDLTVKGGDGCLTVTAESTEASEDESGIQTCYGIVGQKERDRRQGNFTMEGGNLRIYGDISDIDKFEMTGGKIDSLYGESIHIAADDIILTGGELTFTKNQSISEWSWYLLYAEKNIYVKGTKIKVIHETPELMEGNNPLSMFQSPHTVIYGDSISYDKDYFCLEDAYDVYGNAINRFTVTGLPPNAKVKMINGQQTEGLQVSEDGTLQCLLAYTNNLITMDDGSSYKCDYQYDQDNQEEKMVLDTTTPPVTHQVTLQFGEKEQTIEVANGFEFTNRYFDGQKTYDYYDENGKALADDFTVDKDLVLTLKEIKKSSTLDGVKLTEDVLPDGSMYYYEKEIYYSNRYYLAYPGEKVEADVEYKSLPSVQKDGEWYAKIEAKEDLVLLHELIYSDSSINVLLDTDLDFSGEEDVSPLVTDYNGRSYYGIFDGNGHSVMNVQGDQSYMIAQRNYGTIKNVHLKDITLPSNGWSAESQSGILCSANYGTVENCSVESSSIATRKEAEYDDEDTIKLRVHSALVGGNYGTLRNSFAKDITFKGDGDTYPITKSYTGSKIENTYYLSEEAESENAKTAEQFASGEVCSLLNHGVTDGSQYWYQNVDNDGEKDAAPVADPSHGTVYNGYRGCAKVYSNSSLQQTTPSHKISYSADGNVITGICKDDPAHTVKLTVNAKDVVYDGKEHPVTVDTVYSDGWGKCDVPYEITYARGENSTQDITGAGTIKATVVVESVSVEVEYTIKEAPTSTPSVNPASTPSVKPTVTPSVKPTETPKVPSSVKPTQVPAANQPTAPASDPSKQKDTTNKKPSLKKVGTKLEVNGNKYKVTKSKVNKSTVEFIGCTDKKQKKVTIPKTITVGGVRYTVTSIGTKAFSRMKSLNEVQIGSNIAKIGKNVFTGCKKLKTVTIKSKKLTTKSVAKGAFKGISKKTVVTVPKSKYKAYKKLLCAKGLSKKVKIKKQ